MEPMLIGAGIGLSALVAGGIVAEKKGGLYNKKGRQDIRYFRLLPHTNIMVDADKIIRLGEQFASYNRTKQERIKKGREWFRFFIHMDEEGIAFYVGFPEDRQTGVDKAFESTYPECERHPMAHEDIPLPQVKGGYGGRFILREDGERAGLPLRLFDAKRDEWGDVLSFMEPGTWIDLTFSPASLGQLKKIVRRTTQDIRPNGKYAGGWVSAASEFGKEVVQEFNPRNDGSRRVRPSIPKPTQVRDLDSDEQTRYKSVMQRFTGREKVFEVSLCIWSEHQYASSVVQALAARLESMLSYDNGIHLKRSKRCPISDIAPLPLSHQTMIWTAGEMANLFHLPDGKHRVMKVIPHLEGAQRSFEKDEFSTGISMGTLNHPIQKEREAKIPVDTFTKHFGITGKSGGGKSSLLMTIFQSMIDNWIEKPNSAPGFTFFDPAQETVLTILNRLLEAERKGATIPWEKVHYGKLANTNYPIGLNLLHNSNTETVMSLIKKVAQGSNTVRMDRLAYNAVETLIEVGGHNILGLLPLISNEEFRADTLPHIKDYYVNKFWKHEFPAFTEGSDTSVDALINRLSPFTRNLTLRRMVGQSKWSIPIKKYMDEGHIFLIDFLNVDETVKSLAGEHLVNQYHYVTQTRERGKRREHFLVFDEAHLVQVPILTKIFAEDRKFGLCLGLITQYVEQFEPWIQKELMNNTTTIAACLQGSDSSATMSKLMRKYFSPEQLESLPERTAAIRSMNSKNEPDFFMTKSEPPYVYLPDGRIARYKNEQDEQEFLDYTMAKANELQKRDWMSIHEVDREITDYLRNPTILQESRSAKTKHYNSFE